MRVSFKFKSYHIINPIEKREYTAIRLCYYLHIIYLQLSTITTLNIINFPANTVNAIRVSCYLMT